MESALASRMQFQFKARSPQTKLRTARLSFKAQQSLLSFACPKNSPTPMLCLYVRWTIDRHSRQPLEFSSPSLKILQYTQCQPGRPRDFSPNGKTLADCWRDHDSASPGAVSPRLRRRPILKNQTWFTRTRRQHRPLDASGWEECHCSQMQGGRPQVRLSRWGPRSCPRR